MYIDILHSIGTTSKRKKSMPSFLAIMMLVFLVMLSGCTGKNESDTQIGKDYLLLKESQYDENGELSSTLNYSYTEQGKKQSETCTYYYSESLSQDLKNNGLSADPFGFTITYEYENGNYPTLGRISGTTSDGDDMGGYIAMTHDNNGNTLTQWDYDENNCVEMVQKWSYYDNGEVKTYLLGFDESITRQFDEYSYEYNSLGQKISREIHHRYFTKEGKLQDEFTVIDTEYKYDEKGNLSKEYFGTNSSNKSTTEYSYDQNGNIKKKTVFEDNVIIRWTEYEYIKASEIVVAAGTASVEQKQSFLSPGQVVYFGTYEQDNQNYTANEQIEWVVLDVKDNHALLLSTYILDARSFNNGTSIDDTTWETSSIRAWLNSDFYDIAFSSSEKNYIITTHNSTPPNSDWGSYGGNQTDDNVFLLSIEEARKYYPDDDQSIITTQTAYAYSQGCDMYSEVETSLGVSYKTYSSWGTIPDDYPGTDGTFAYWWLRSPGNCTNDTYGRKCIRSAYVKADDYPITMFGEFQSHKLGVRPAIWIDLTHLSSDDLVKKASDPAKEEASRNEQADALN